jgi:hypothetical protein
MTASWFSVLVCRLRGHRRSRFAPTGGPMNEHAYRCVRCGVVLERYRWAIRSNVVSENGWELVEDGAETSQSGVG